MMYNFETEVTRDNQGNLKYEMTPEQIKKAGFTSFDAAEMDFPTFPGITERVAALARNGLFGYTIRTEEYDKAVCSWMKHVRNWEVPAEELVTAQGTIFSVASLIRLLTKPGERIITQPPVYYRYEQAATRLGRETAHNRLIEKGGVYTMDFADLEEKMADPLNKLLVICNPQNPVGRVWSKEELTEIGRLSSKYKVPVFSDEIFAEITFDGHETIPYASIEEGRTYAITCTSLGKAFSLTGLNHANVFIPDQKLRERFETQRQADHYGSIEPLAYAAVLGGYTKEGAAWLSEACSYIEENKKLLQKAVQTGDIPGRLSPVEGTFVGWIFWDTLGVKEEEIQDFLENKAFFHAGAGVEYDTECKRYSRINLSCTHRQLAWAIERLKTAAKGENYDTGRSVRLPLYTGNDHSENVRERL